MPSQDQSGPFVTDVETETEIFGTKDDTCKNDTFAAWKNLVVNNEDCTAPAEKSEIFIPRREDTEVYRMVPEISETPLNAVCLQSCDLIPEGRKQEYRFNPVTCQLHPEGPSGGAPPSGSGSHGAEAPNLQGGSGSAPANPSSGGADNQGPTDDNGSDDSSEEEIYSLNEDPTGWVYIMNNINGCDDNALDIGATFRDLGYRVVHIPEIINSYIELENYFKNITETLSPLVVVFFGYGYDEHIFIGTGVAESLSYRKFFEVMKAGKERKPLILFTNTCFKAVNNETRHYEESDEPVVDAFHLCVKIIGNCQNGSLFAKLFIEELRENSKEEIYSLTRGINRKLHAIEDGLSAEERNQQDHYTPIFRGLGIYKLFHFSSPSRVQE